MVEMFRHFALSTEKPEHQSSVTTPMRHFDVKLLLNSFPTLDPNRQVAVCKHAESCGHTAFVPPGGGIALSVALQGLYTFKGWIIDCTSVQVWRAGRCAETRLRPVVNMA